MEEQQIKTVRVVVTGPESTGKSTLCRQLAAHYQTLWVPEFARAYLEKYGPGYTQNDLFAIAEGQLATEAELVTNWNDKSSARLLLVDTDLQVIRIWSEYVFGTCDNRILKKISDQHCDLYLLCDTDLPWEPDPLREYPDPLERKRLLHYYLDTMVNQSAPWQLISGRETQRLQAAIQAVDAILHQS